MEKYKICPACRAHNKPQSLECIECEADLQNVPIVDEQLEQANLQNTKESVTLPGVMVRICDCGAKNPFQARRCSICGEDISMIIPVPDTASVVQRYLLTSLDNTYRYEIKEGRTIIGRENEMKEYLLRKPYVSRTHAELVLNIALGKLTIRNCNMTNYTFINNTKISGDISVELKDGDEIGLGGNGQEGSRQAEAAYFIVKVIPCT